MVARIFMVLLLGLCLHISEIKAEPVSIQTAWLDEMETFPVWYAHKNKWDLEENIVLTMNSYSTGRVLVDSFSSAKWKIAGCGLIPALKGVTEKDFVIIALGVDETKANVIYGRKEGKIAERTETNNNFPAVKGDKHSVVGSLLLCPYGTNSHRLLLKWIEIAGVNEDLVTIQDMNPDKAVSGVINGFGDAVSFWLPAASAFYENDILVKLADARECGLSFYTVIVADKKFVETNSNEIQAFINVYLKAADALAALPEEEKIQLYKEFRWEWGNTALTDNAARLELETHQFYSAQEQKKFFLQSQENSIYSVIQEAIPFVENYFALDRRNKEFLESYSYINAAFLEK